ncbi:hypothetical protein C5Z26_01055 [Lactobacillus sp. CBA3606]|uniref:nuclear transport factor 2 family protein n=1 Tax=Lactobacillus sp. CBA3606 TaxID=2099789 RepID=UPI000CFDA838|nr:nuclear transport factor 2 family protein [Lactobacillus sp. CBA3606]AVK62796.1 hypothetical protein C5Z26_01055 [Lactobacillus sp. CBA3606]
MEKNKAIDGYRQFNVAMRNSDVTTLKQLLSSDFTLTHMSGFVQPIDQWLAQIANGQMHYFSSREQSVNARAIKNGWQVTGNNIVNAQINRGIRTDWQLHTVMEIIEKDGIPVIQKAVVTPY